MDTLISDTEVPKFKTWEVQKNIFKIRNVSEQSEIADNCK